MKVDLYERIWMWMVGVMLALFFASTAIAAFGGAVHPPSHVETIDPAKVLTDARFRTPGVSVDQAGRVHARIVGMTFAWLPATLAVPAATPITFHVTAMDVVHGFEIVRTNGQSMVIPGYVSQFTTVFPDTGEYLVTCNEYCGVGHHTMSAKLHVVPKAAWRAPVAAQVPPASALDSSSHRQAGGADDDR
jgi:cytochrome c oxidase subunit II